MASRQLTEGADPVGLMFYCSKFARCRPFVLHVFECFV